MARKTNSQDPTKKRLAELESLQRETVRDLRVEIDRRFKQMRLEVDQKLEELADQISAQVDALIVGKADRITLAAIFAEMSRRFQDKNGS